MSARPTSRQTYGPEYIDVREETLGGAEDNPSTPPSIEQYEKLEKASCNINTRKFFCMTHNCPTTKVALSTKKWGNKGGGRGYGWLHQKVSKEICRPRDRVLGDHDISTSVVISNRSPGLETSERESHFGNKSFGLVGITMSDQIK